MYVVLTSYILVGCPCFVVASVPVSVVPVASSLSLVDGVVFAGQSDVLSELISSSRSRGVSVVNLPRCGFAASR